MNEDTILKLKRDIQTPYNHYHIGEYARIEYWSSKFGKTSKVFIEDFLTGSLDEWFCIYTIKN